MFTSLPALFTSTENAVGEPPSQDEHLAAVASGLPGAGSGAFPHEMFRFKHMGLSGNGVYMGIRYTPSYSHLMGEIMTDRWI